MYSHSTPLLHHFAAIWYCCIAHIHTPIIKFMKLQTPLSIFITITTNIENNCKSGFILLLLVSTLFNVLVNFICQDNITHFIILKFILAVYELFMISMQDEILWLSLFATIFKWTYHSDCTKKWKLHQYNNTHDWQWRI